MPIKSLEDKKRKWINFIGGGNGGGNGGTIEKTMFFIDVDDDLRNERLRPLPQPGLKEARIDWAYDEYNRRLAQAEWLNDDRIPALMPYTGTEIFAEAFGCKVFYPHNDMPFALPKCGDICEAASMKVPGVHDTPLDMLFEIARRLRQKAGDGAAMQLPDIQSPFDIAALLINKEAFYVAMIEAPEAVHELIGKTKALLTSFLDEWFAEFGVAYIAHYPQYYMEGGVTLSEDEVGAFSSGMFDTFVLDTLNELSERYGGIGVHCCAHSEHQWANLKKAKGLLMLNLVNNPDFIRRSLDFYRGTVAMWPMSGPPAYVNPPWMDGCPPEARVVLNYRAPTRDAAIETAKRAEGLCDMRNNKKAVSY